MRPKRYVDELKIRRKYRKVGRRRGYIQRKLYEYNREEKLEDLKTDGKVEEIIEYQEEERLLKGLSDRGISFSIEICRRRRRASGRCYRTMSPGRFRQESKKRIIYLLRRNGGRIIRRRKWYLSEVDVRRSDRRRNIGRYVLRVWCIWISIEKYQFKQNRKGEKRRELRGRIVWSGRRIWVWRSDERFDRSTRRSMIRSRIGYRRVMERRIRGRYRNKGRKWK